MRKLFEADEVRTWLHEAFEAGYKLAMGPIVPRDMAFQKKTLAKLQTIAPEVMDKGIEVWRYLTSEEHKLREHRIRHAARLVGKDEEHAISMILDGLPKRKLSWEIPWTESLRAASENSFPLDFQSPAILDSRRCCGDSS